MRLHPSIVAQLADFQAWSKTGPDSEPITLLDYVGFVATPDLLFGFAELFWPELIVHDGLHFLASGFLAETYDGWVRKGISRREIQRVLNHLHVTRLIQQQDISYEVALEVARFVAAIWTRTLGPEGLVAEVVGDNLTDIAITFAAAEPAD